MRAIKAFISIAVLAAAFASMSSVANAALPSVLLLATVTSASTTAVNTSTIGRIVHSIGTFLSNIWKGTRILIDIDANMTSLGPATLSLTNSEFDNKKCKANGDATGTVLIPAEWHTVLASSGGGAKLFLTLFLVTPALTIECEGTNIIVTGSWLIDTEPFGSEVTATTATTGKCEEATPAFSKYLNDEGKEAIASLKTEAGGLKSSSCLEIEGTQNYTSTQMLEVMEP